MAATSALAIGMLAASEIDAGLALSDEAGWNQTAEDWRLFVTAGEVFAVRDEAGAVIATAALLPYASKAWISLVLVTARWRREGLASALMARCIAAADTRGLTPWLDATPAGAAVYEKMGFIDLDDGTLRLGRHAAPAPSRSAEAGALHRLVADDRHVMATDRARLLHSLAERPGSRLYAHQDAVCLVRDGRTRRHVGPVVAANEAQAIVLLDHLLARESSPLIIDVSERCTILVQHLIACGFAVERAFRRMRRGEKDDGATTPFATAGPEYG